MASKYEFEGILFLAAVSLAAFVRGEAPDHISILDPGLAVAEPLKEIIVVKKTKLTLNCSAIVEKEFQPVTFQWKKDGAPIRGQHQRIITYENGTLHFTRIIHRDRGGKKKTDEGLYECYVTNSVGTVISQRVHVKVARISRKFTKEPQSQVAHLGGIVVFQCQMNSVPNTFYVWEKDRRPLGGGNKRFLTYASGLLQINNVRKEDAGIYRCTTTNKELFKIEGNFVQPRWRSSVGASLNISRGKQVPYMKVLVKPATVTVVKAGEKVILECIVDGFPRPVISWTKSDSFYKGDIIHGGSLSIEKVNRDDAGDYKCHAKSSDGIPDIVLSAHLDVIVEPLITNGPESVSFPVARTVILPCAAKGVPDPVIRWLKDGKEIISNGRIQIVPKGELRIYNSGVHDSGYYQCIAENDAGWTATIGRIKIELQHLAPDPPKKLRAYVLSSTEVSIHWETETKNGSLPILSFTVHYAKEGSMEEEVIILTQSNEVNLSNLLPFTNYTFYVKVYNSKGASRNSEVITFTTDETVPTEVPTIMLTSRNETSILVQWDPLDAESSRGIIVKYRIYYGPNNSKEVKMKEVDGNETEYLLTGLKPNTKYRFRMLAGTKKGFPQFEDKDWPWINHKRWKTLGEASVAPVLKVQVIDATTVKVTWSYKTPVAIDDHVIFLKNIYSSAGTIQMYHLDAYSREVTLHDLIPNCAYELFLLAKYRDVSKGMVTKMFQTEKKSSRNSTGVRNIPKNISVFVIKSSAISLTWRYPSGDSILYFVVRYRRIATSSLNCPVEKESGKTLQSHSPEATLVELEPFTWYNITVRAQLATGEGPFSTPVLVQTKEDVPSKPESVEAKVVSPGEVELRWLPPEKPNGIIQGHYILYNFEVSEAERMLMEVYQAGQNTAALVQNLTKHKYSFQIQACTKIGRGAPSSKLVVDLNLSTERRVLLSDKHIGILGGAAIGLTSIIVTVIVILCKQRQLTRKYARSTSNHSPQPQTPDTKDVPNGIKCVCKKDKPPACEVEEPIIMYRDPGPRLAGVQDVVKNVDDARLSAALANKTYHVGCNAQAEELWALLASRDGSYSSSGDSKTASIDSAREEPHEEMLQLTNDTRC